jgi:hypothetical protein
MFFSAVNIRDSSSIMFLVSLLYYYRYRNDESEAVKQVQQQELDVNEFA